MRTKEVTLAIPEYLYEESLKLTSAGLFRDLSELVSAGLRRELQAAKELLGPEETNWQEELSRLRAQIREKRAKYGITVKSEEETLDELRAVRRELWEMGTRLQNLIDAAQELSPLEQLELISTISQSLHRNCQQAVDFWEPKTLEQLIQAQQTQPITDIADLAGSWPEEESVDDFIEYIYQQRREDRLRD
jgi:Arc/MetJ-type ribon-helix-helix transcriptional regulator